MTNGAKDLYPLTFEPEVLVKVWGGKKLVTEFNKPASDQPLGESWEVSAVPGHVSVVDDGPLAGKNLQELIDSYGAALVGERVHSRHSSEFPLLLKIIDAADDLSVQVHPNHEQAARLGGGAQSKNEAWLILSVDPGARIVHGVAPGVDRAKFEKLVADGEIEKSLRFIEVQPGDVVPMQPGTLHAIGKGVVLLELQESSDTTYRFYDYNRLGLDGKPRELHIEQALAVVNLESGEATVDAQPLEGEEQRSLLHRDQAIEMQRWQFTKPVELAADGQRPWLITTLDGALTITSDSPNPRVRLPVGRSALIPAGLDVTLEPTTSATVHLGSIPMKDE